MTWTVQRSGSSASAGSAPAAAAPAPSSLAASGEGRRGGRGVHMEARGAASASSRWWPEEGRRACHNSKSIAAFPSMCSTRSDMNARCFGTFLTHGEWQRRERSIHGGEGRCVGAGSVVAGGGAAKLRETEKGGRGELAGTSNFSELASMTARPSSLCAPPVSVLGCACELDASVRSQSDGGEMCDRLNFQFSSKLIRKK
jgi:hypothetical protein